MLGSLRGWREGCPHLLSASDGEFVAIVLFLHDGSKEAAIRASSQSVIGVTNASQIIRDIAVAHAGECSRSRSRVAVAPGSS